jgi:hypothetical protein
MTAARKTKPVKNETVERAELEAEIADAKAKMIPLRRKLDGLIASVSKLEKKVKPLREADAAKRLADGAIGWPELMKPAIDFETDVEREEFRRKLADEFSMTYYGRYVKSRQPAAAIMTTERPIGKSERVKLGVKTLTAMLEPCADGTVRFNVIDHDCSESGVIELSVSLETETAKILFTRYGRETEKFSGTIDSCVDLLFAMAEESETAEDDRDDDD